MRRSWTLLLAIWRSIKYAMEDHGQTLSRIPKSPVLLWNSPRKRPLKTG